VEKSINPHQNKFLPMKRYLLAFLSLSISFFNWAQGSKTIPQKALERYPMLQICRPAGIGEDILCGTLYVKENRTLRNGRTLPINIYVFPSYRPNPNNSSYIDYAGGPGVPNTIFINEFVKGAFTAEFREYRDILLLDLRGTGASRLNCQAYDTLKVDTRSRIYDPETAKSCFKELRSKVDLSQYNTDNAVEDINQVLDWLKIYQLDFSGGSYGTRIGIELARRYPNRVSSLILTGTVPPDFGLANFADLEIEKQLQKLSIRCQNDKKCSGRFPDFLKKMHDLAERLDKNPIVYAFKKDSATDAFPIVIDGDHFRSMIAQQVARGGQMHLIPLMAYEADIGNFGPLIKNSIGSKIVHPVEWCQFCTEEPYTKIDPQYRQRSLQFFTKGLIGFQDAEVCKTWGIQPYPQWLSKDLRLDMPVLLITGSNDVLTPPRMADKIHEAATNSRHVVFSGQGHALSDWDCWKDLVLGFLMGTPLDKLDSQCAENYELPKFITDTSKLK